MGLLHMYHLSVLPPKQHTIPLSVSRQIRIAYVSPNLTDAHILRLGIAIAHIGSDDQVHNIKIIMAMNFDAIEAMSKLLHSMKHSNVSSMLVSPKNGITKDTVIC